MRRIISTVVLLVVLSGICHLRSSAQAISGDGFVHRLKTYLTNHPAEQAYLQFDKPYYAGGDTIYFKAYVTMGERHLLSVISGVLHVDLINTKDRIDQSIKLRLADGVAWGDFALPDSLPKGNYRVRAWTQWMRNDSNFFEKAIPVGSLQNTKVTESGKSLAAVSAKPDVQFFPEGGNLVAGIRSKVAFKAIGPNGLSIAIRGVVIDNDNKEIVSFASVHLGMGSFEFVPEPGKTYHAKLTYANGMKGLADLPQPEEKGIALSVNNDSIPVAKVRMEADRAFFAENKGKNYTLLIYSGGIATIVPCSLDSAVITLDILKRKLFTGVTTITLFSPNNEPLCERLIFVQNYDQLSLNISMDKAGYAPREKVNIEINAKTRADSAAMGHFSVSITDESKVPVDENDETTILTNLLLTSDVKGYVEQPNYYFNHINDTTSKNLDLVMLTHGYRRFEWKRILDNGYPTPAFQPENNITISGTAKSLLGKPVVHGTVSLIPTKGGPVLSQATDDKGNFHFSNLFFTDTGRFVLNATKANGKNSTQIVYKIEKLPVVDPFPLMNAKTNTDTVMMPYLENSEKQQEELNRLGLGKGRMLREVKIRAFKEDDHYPTSNIFGPGHADQVIHAKEIGNMGGLLGDRLNGKLRGVVIYNGQAVLHGFEPLVIVVDNIVVKSLNIINSNDVETVELFSSGAGGYIFITTKQGTGIDPKDIASTGILPVTVQGFYKATLFYAPKYEHPNDYVNRKDLRSTIYWQPEVLTDKDGTASVEFYNADGTGNYRVVIEGIDEKGNIGRQVYRYKVE